MPRTILVRPPGGATGRVRRRYAVRQKLQLLEECNRLRRVENLSLRGAAAAMSIPHTVLVRWTKARPRLIASLGRMKAICEGPSGSCIILLEFSLATYLGIICFPSLEKMLCPPSVCPPAPGFLLFGDLCRFLVGSPSRRHPSSPLSSCRPPKNKIKYLPASSSPHSPLKSNSRFYFLYVQYASSHISPLNNNIVHDS